MWNSALFSPVHDDFHHRRRLFNYMKSLVISGAIIAMSTGCVQDPDSTLTITSIEINQATQTTADTIDLVAQRSTTVRVMLDTGSSNAIDPVTGLLSVYVDGAMITPVGGVAATNNEISLPASPDRYNEDDSLYFELPAPTGITASSDVDFFVVVTGNGQLDEQWKNNVTFRDMDPPVLYYVPVDYTPSGLGFPDPVLIAPGTGDAFVQGIFPIDDSNPNTYQQLLAPGVGYSADSDGDGILNCVDNNGDGDREDCSDKNNLMSGLASTLGLVIIFGGSLDSHLYGWLAGNPIAGNGSGVVNGQVAYGNTQESRHQRTFAHELGHNLGLSHNSRTLDEPGWDTTARLEGNPAANNTTGRVKTSALFDIMVGGRLTANAWVDTTTYNAFLGSSILSARLATRRAASTNPGIFVVQGEFDNSGNLIKKVEPSYHYAWRRSESPQHSGDPYVIEVQDTSGTVYRRSFNALVGYDDTENTELFGFFEVRLAIPAENPVERMRILDAEDESTVLYMEQASTAPDVRVLAPSAGVSLGRQTEIQWQINDPDTDESKMQYQIAYSHDGGNSWVPLKVDIAGSETGAIVNTREVQASDGNGIIRVFVSDGLNTTYADISDLSTSQAIY